MAQATHDLSATDVKHLAAALGLPLTAEDVTEVMHRLNAMRDALAALCALPTHTAEPAPPAP